MKTWAAILITCGVACSTNGSGSDAAAPVNGNGDASAQVDAGTPAVTVGQVIGGASGPLSCPPSKCNSTAAVDTMSAGWGPLLDGVGQVVGNPWEYRTADQDGEIGLGLVVAESANTTARYALKKAAGAAHSKGLGVSLAFACVRHQEGSVCDSATVGKARAHIASVLSDTSIGPYTVAITIEAEYDNAGRAAAGGVARDVKQVADLVQALVDGAKDAKWSGRILSPPVSPIDTIGTTAAQGLHDELATRGLLSSLHAAGMHAYYQSRSTAVTDCDTDIRWLAALYTPLPVQVDQTAVDGTKVDPKTFFQACIATQQSLWAGKPLPKDGAGRTVYPTAWWWPATEGVTVGVLGSNPALVTATGSVTSWGTTVAGLR